MKNPIEIFNYLDNGEFIRARNLLAQEGIDNFYTTHGPSDIDGRGRYYKIFIEEEDYNKAKTIESNFNKTIINDENEKFSFCPKCDFDEIESIKLPTLKSFLLNSKIECKCKKCGYKWYAKNISTI